MASISSILDFVKSQVFQYLVAGAILLISGFMLGSYIKGINIQRATEVKLDTLRIEIKKDSMIYQLVNKFIYKAGRIDTIVKIDSVLTDSSKILPTIVYASFDTLLKYKVQDSLQLTDSLSIKYYFPETNIWDISLKKDIKLYSYTKDLLVRRTEIPPPYAAPYKRYFWDRFDYGPTISIGVNNKGLTWLAGVGIFYGLR